MQRSVSIQVRWMEHSRLKFMGYFYGLQGVDYWVFVDFQLILMEMGVLVHPQLGLRFGATLPFVFLQKNNTFAKKKNCFC